MGERSVLPRSRGGKGSSGFWLVFSPTGDRLVFLWGFLVLNVISSRCLFQMITTAHSSNPEADVWKVLGWLRAGVSETGWFFRRDTTG